jgi:hypothetical protein
MIKILRYAAGLESCKRRIGQRDCKRKGRARSGIALMPFVALPTEDWDTLFKFADMQDIADAHDTIQHLQSALSTTKHKLVRFVL